MEHKRLSPEGARELDGAQIVQLIEARPGDLFTLDFIKADGSPRRMNAQWGVNGKRDSKLPYDPAKGGNIVVFDCSKAQCRTVKVESILGVNYGDGVQYVGPAGA